jgi:hypothetical protein
MSTDANQQSHSPDKVDRRKFIGLATATAGAMFIKPELVHGTRKFGWRVMPDRVANLTVNHRGRPAYHFCDQCQRGCFTASYFQQSFGNASGGRPHREIHARERCHRQPLADGPERAC